MKAVQPSNLKKSSKTGGFRIGFTCILKMGTNGVFLMAPVAQLDSASGFEPEGCRFEPCRVRQFTFNSLLSLNDGSKSGNSGF